MSFAGTFLLYILPVLILVLVWLYTKFHYRKLVNFWTTKGVPFLHQQNGLLKRIYLKQTILETDGCIYHQMGPQQPFAGGSDEFGLQSALYVKDFDLIKSICVKDFDFFTNRRVMKQMGKLPSTAIYPKMLFFQQDQQWKDLRAKMTPTFTTGKIKKMFDIFNSSSEKLVQEMRKQLSTLSSSRIGKLDVNLEPIFGKYGVDVIASTAFGLETSIFEESNSIFEEMSRKLQALTVITPKTLPVFIVAMLFPKLASKMKFISASVEVNDYFTSLIQSTMKYRRESSDKRRNDFLQLMLDAQTGALAQEKDEHSSTETEAEQRLANNLDLTDDLIIAQCMQFFIAGLDSIQSGLVFVPYLLALNPECQEKLHRELKSSYDSNGGKFSHELIMENSYLDKVISETLRIFPPAQRMERKCTKNYQLPETNIIIPADTPILIPVYNIHHDEANYPEPTRFDPERFSSENKARRNPYSYLPFGVGPRMCIANRFAISELKTAASHLILNFKFEPCEQTTIPMKFKPSSGLKPEVGVWLRIEARN